MPDLGDGLLAAATLVPLIAAAARGRRSIAVAAALFSALLAGVSASPFLLAGHSAPDLVQFGGPNAALFDVDAMSALPLVLYACLAVGVLVACPRSDGAGTGYSGILILISGTLATYGAGHPLTLFLGWLLTAIPFLANMSPAERGHSARPRLPWIAILASVALLAAGLTLMSETPGFLAFTLIVLAALVRKGVFPFHTWVVAAFAEGPLLAMGLLLNAHLGAFVIARVAIPLMPDLSRDAMTLISSVALVSALYAAFAGLGERNPRRSLALLMISQSSFVLAGLESRNAEGITGALTFAIVVSMAVMGLLIAYRAIEKRYAAAGESEFGGLAAHAPRLAAFFAVCGLALVGLPGTLGFVAEDLLFHGALSGHPLLGIALPLATALNAINVFRLFSSIFFGRRSTSVPAFPDALLRERLVLSAMVLFLVICGIAPRWVIDSRVTSAEAISTVFSRTVARDAAR